MNLRVLVVQPREALAHATGRTSPRGRLRADPRLRRRRSRAGSRSTDPPAAVVARPDAARARRLGACSPRSAPVRPDRWSPTDAADDARRAVLLGAGRYRPRSWRPGAGARPVAAGTRTRFERVDLPERETRAQRPKGSGARGCARRTGGTMTTHPARRTFRPPTPSGASGSHPSSSRSLGRPAPSGPSPASTGTATRTAPTRASAAARPLFSSETKFESGSGWPSFWQPIDGRRPIEEQSDTSYGMVRTEVRATTAAPTSGTSSPTAPARPGCATASTAPSLRLEENELGVARPTRLSE